MSEKSTVVLAIATGLLFAQPARADVTFGISVGTPPAPPPVVVAAPPHLVVVPGTAVYYAPGVSFNLFAYAGRYYSFHNGAWFVATSHKGPWTVVAAERVPAPVLAVPVAYYKVPPGHAKKLVEPPGHGRGPKAKTGRED